MSAFEPDTMPTKEARINLPGFQVALRGYDRPQVDAFVQELARRLSAERLRAEQAERAVAQMQFEASTKHQSPPSFEHLGSEAARVLEQAGASAKLLVEEAKSRGAALLDEAQARAKDLIERAEQQVAQTEATARKASIAAAKERDRFVANTRAEAEQLRAQADKDARAVLEEARQAAGATRAKAAADQAEMEAETDRLREFQTEMLGYLSQVHSRLGVLIGEPAGAKSEPPPSEPVSEAVTEAEAAPGLNGEAEPVVEPKPEPVNGAQPAGRG
jgi:DivIVA domain-containing protein